MLISFMCRFAAAQPASGVAFAALRSCQMGQRVKNIEAVTDYADNRHYVRLHRDILLPAEVCEAVRRHLSAGRWEEAKSLALEHASADAHDEIYLFFDSTAARLACGSTPFDSSFDSASRRPESPRAGGQLRPVSASRPPGLDFLTREPGCAKLDP